MAAGFTPWFDTQIRTGHRLDAQIEQGIRDVAAAGGRAVLLMIQHALRRGSGTDYGYCLNELALILDLGMDLVPIMIEPCERPGSIQALTYLDLTAQAEVLIAPAPEGEQARVAAAERIATALREGPVSLRIDDPDLLLRGKLRPRTFRPPPNLLPNPVPRTWITDKVDDWLLRDSRGLLITGTTGTGKSAFLRMLDDYRGGLTSLHYFKADDSQTLDLGHVVNTMAFKLAATVPGYRSTLIALLQGPEGAELLALEPLARFRRLVVEPVADLPEPAHPVVIAFDALDEAGNRQRNKALELLEVVADSAHLLPPWFRLLATSRPEAEVITALRGWERLDIDSYANTLVADDCRELAAMYLPEETPERREQLVTLAEGNLLVLNLYLEEVQADRRDPEHAKQDADAPQDSHAAHGAPAQDSPLDLRYTRTIRRRLGTPALDPFQRDVLACALSARRPLPLDVIAAATGRTRNDAEQFARALGSLVLMQGHAADRHLRLFHGSFAEWLADPDRSDATHVDAGDGHRLLADLAWARYLDGTLVRSAYLGTRLEVHLAASGQEQRLAQATTDADYIAVRLRAADDDGHGQLDTAALWRIGSRCRAAGDLWVARHALAAAVQASRLLADADRPGLANVEGYLTLAESLSRMAAFSLASGRFTDALEECDEACHILVGLAHEPERDNAKARLDVAQAHQEVGQLALLCGQPDRAAESFCASVVERAAVAQQAASASADERDDADDDGDAPLVLITDGAVLLRGKHGRLRFQTPVATLLTAAAAPEDPEVTVSVDHGQVLPDTTERGVHATVVMALHSAGIRMAQASGGDDWSSRVDAEDRLWHALLAGDPDLVGTELDSSDVDDERLAVLIARAVAAGRECGNPALAANVALAAAERRATPELAALLGNVAGVVGEPILTPGERRPVAHAAEAVARQLCADHPDIPTYNDNLAGVLLNLGILEQKVGATGPARTAYTEAQARYRQLCADHPDIPNYNDSLAIVLFGLARVAEAESGPRSPSALRAWREAVLMIDDLDRRGQLPPARRGFAAHARARSGAGQSPPPTPAATPTWLPIGAPAPTPLAITRAVDTWLEAAPWLDGETWVDSYAHLAAHRSLFTAREAHSELIAQADEDDLPRHLAILELFTAGMSADELEAITTQPQVALNLIVQTLTDHQTGLAARVLAACPALSEIPQGRALDLAVTLVDRNPAQAQHTAAQLAATRDAGQVAAEFDRVAEALAIVLDAD